MSNVKHYNTYDPIYVSVADLAAVLSKANEVAIIVHESDQAIRVFLRPVDDTKKYMDKVNDMFYILVNKKADV